MSRVILCNEPLKIVLKENASNIYPGETSFASRLLMAQLAHSQQRQDIIRKR